MGVQAGNNTDDEAQFEPLGVTQKQLHDGIRDILSRLFAREYLVGQAQDYPIRLPPDERLEQVRGRSSSSSTAHPCASGGSVKAGRLT